MYRSLTIAVILLGSATGCDKERGTSQSPERGKPTTAPNPVRHFKVVYPWTWGVLELKESKARFYPHDSGDVHTVVAREGEPVVPGRPRWRNTPTVVLREGVPICTESKGVDISSCQVTEIERDEFTARTKRPQTPAPDSKVEELEGAVEIDGGPTLAYTITVPRSGRDVPAALLVSGSGPDGRDYAADRHLMFAVLAHHLAKRGIATLRFDEPGQGESSGSFADFGYVQRNAALRRLHQALADHPRVDDARVGVVGHSEGGINAAILAVNQPSLAFTVLLASPVREGVHLVRAQISLKTGLKGKVADEMARAVHVLMTDEARSLSAEKRRALASRVVEPVRQLLADLPDDERRRRAHRLLHSVSEPYVVGGGNSVNFDPDVFRVSAEQGLRKSRVPVLAVIPGKDIAIDGKVVAERLRVLARANPGRRVDIAVFDDLDHALRPADPVGEQRFITVDPAVLERLSDWILSLDDPGTK